LHDLLDAVLGAARYPIRAIETESESEEQVELTATRSRSPRHRRSLMRSLPR
jgi:hypothetical protein